MTLQTMSFIFGGLLLAVAILGGGFEVKEIKISNASTGVRILAGVVGLAFMVIGRGDYTGFDANTDHIEDCETACEDDTKCAAWTYVKPGVQGPHARCYLKYMLRVRHEINH